MSDNITDPLKPTTQTSYFRVFAGAVVCAILLPLFMAFGNAVLPPADAADYKQLLLSSIASVGGGSGLAVLASGLKKTFSKIEEQKARASDSSGEEVSR